MKCLIKAMAITLCLLLLIVVVVLATTGGYILFAHYQEYKTLNIDINHYIKVVIVLFILVYLLVKNKKSLLETVTDVKKLHRNYNTRKGKKKQWKKY